jgi:hypothetical protein
MRIAEAHHGDIECAAAEVKDDTFCGLVIDCS